MNNKLSRAARIEQNWGWFMVAPTIIGLIVLNVWPFIQTIYASFCEHQQISVWASAIINSSVSATMSTCSRTPSSGAPPATPCCSAC